VPFVAVADCGGFHRPAERLNLTQSTISQQIKRLEFETKRPLFRRTMRSVALTDDGEMLLGDARRLLQLEGGPPSPLSGGNSLTVTSAAEQAPVSATAGYAAERHLDRAGVAVGANDDQIHAVISRKGQDNVGDRSALRQHLLYFDAGTVPREI
jgi:DNA-binding MarR family transcriptional regulator